MQSKSLGQRADFSIVFWQLHEKRRVVQPQQDVLGDRLRGYQHEVLMHHADPGLNGIPWRRKRHRLALDLDNALFGAIQARKHVHQRALACAVFPQQCMDFSGPQLKIDVIVGDHAGKTLDDAAHFDDERGVVFG